MPRYVTCRPSLSIARMDEGMAHPPIASLGSMLKKRGLSKPRRSTKPAVAFERLLCSNVGCTGSRFAYGSAEYHRPGFERVAASTRKESIECFKRITARGYSKRLRAKITQRSKMLPQGRPDDI